jgi:hypothetical protein
MDTNRDGVQAPVATMETIRQFYIRTACIGFALVLSGALLTCIVAVSHNLALLTPGVLVLFLGTGIFFAYTAYGQLLFGSAVPRLRWPSRQA